MTLSMSAGASSFSLTNVLDWLNPLGPLSPNEAVGLPMVVMKTVAISLSRSSIDSTSFSVVSAGVPGRSVMSMVRNLSPPDENRFTGMNAVRPRLATVITIAATSVTALWLSTQRSTGV